MIISLVVAMDEKGGIGKSNRLPWRLPSDLKRFKLLTMGHYIVMGRKTYETIGRPLPGRQMVVITHQKSYRAPGCSVVHSLEEALQVVKASQENEVFIIGGGTIFQQAIGLADKIYITNVLADVNADVKFPKYDPEQWTTEVEYLPTLDGQDEFESKFKILARKH